MSESRPDYYALLGLRANADGTAIRAAYRALAKQHHPDMADDEAFDSTEQFVRIQEAYDVLRDPVRRKQYDDELVRLAASNEAERRQREMAYRQALSQGPAPIGGGLSKLFKPLSSSPRTSGVTFWVYVTVTILAVVAAGLIVDHRRAEREKDQIMIVKVDPPRPTRQDVRSADGLPSDISNMSKEIERLSKERIERVEQAKKRMQAEIENANKKKEALAAPPAAPAAPPPRIDCNGEGRTFTVLRQKEAISVAFNGGPPVQPSVHDPGTGIIIVSKFEPTNRLSIGFMKGDKNGTVILVADATGNVFRTFGVDCNAAAF